MPSALAVAVMRSANFDSEPEMCSAMTRAMSLAESVTSALMAFSTVIFEPALNPSFVGTAAAAYLLTVILSESLMFPAASSWNRT
jgi:hypothetical protein